MRAELSRTIKTSAKTKTKYSEFHQLKIYIY